MHPFENQVSIRSQDYRKMQIKEQLSQVKVAKRDQDRNVRGTP